MISDKWLKRFIVFQGIVYVIFMIILIVLMCIGTLALVQHLMG